MIENLIFGKTGFKTSVFENHFISYSCILFIKYYAFRSFCIKLLCFSKKLCFPDFRSIESVSQPIENAIKILVRIWPTRSLLDQSKVIFDWLNLIFNQSKSYREFFKNLKLFMSSITFKLFKSFSLSLQSV